MRYLIILLVLILPGLCYPDVYLETDSQGDTVFTDAPNNENAEKLNIGTTSSQGAKNSTPPPIAHPVAAKQTPVEQPPEHKPYLVLTIIAPKDQASIQNQPSITVSVATDPALQPGDKIAVFLDGQMWGAPSTSTTPSFPAPDKGTHQLSAKILDKDGQVLAASGSNTIYVHQAHTGSPPLN